MKHRIGITAWGSLSALGATEKVITQSTQSEKSGIHFDHTLNGHTAPLANEAQLALDNFLQNYPNYQHLDRSVQLALAAADRCFQKTAWKNDNDATGLSLGSSRGATQLFEQYYAQHLNDEPLPVRVSPTTTLGNLSTNVARHLGLSGPAISHSVTCSTALHALLNAVNWLESGRCQRFLVGGSEAPLTDFTLAQMRRLRIYSRAQTSASYPCRPLDESARQNTMVLGEAAACFSLELEPQQPALAYITGLGYGQELMESATGMSQSGEGFQQSMRMALAEAGITQPDGIICHSPGTRQGDQAELYAIRAVFDKNIPHLSSNKWKIGHTLGASGAMSLLAAILMLEQQFFVGIPYNQIQPFFIKKPIQHLMVSAAGFGGNVVSIVLSKKPH